MAKCIAVAFVQLIHDSYRCLRIAQGCIVVDVGVHYLRTGTWLFGEKKGRMCVYGVTIAILKVARIWPSRLCGYES